MELTVIKERLETQLKEAQQEAEQIEAQLEIVKPDFGLGKGSAGTDSWERALARKQEINARIESLQQALQRAKNNTYGQCANCGLQINPERLEIMPTATLCINCAKQQ